MNRQQAAETVLRRRSALAVAFFGWQFSRQLKQNFTAVRLSINGQLPDLEGLKVVVYSNHPSWWDAVVYVFLDRILFRGRMGYGPIDAAQLARYPFLERMGIFGIEPDTATGARRFLAIAKAVLARPGTVMWVTAEGRFTDPHIRPIALRRGIARLSGQVPGLVFLPLAIDYAFWSEKRPELLLRFGKPLTGSGRDMHSMLEAALTDTMDSLAVDSSSRDPARFTTLLRGRRGVHGVYDSMRRFSAMAKGKPFDPGHFA
jgi:1-acyl-sn-glycerol-3-phosphate acyltransferase